MTSPESSCASDVSSASRTRRGPFILAMVLLVAGWAVVMTFRWELRAQWWAYQVTQAESKEDRDDYVVRLASLRDKSLGALPRLLNDARPEIRECAVKILRFCSSSAAADHLLALLHDPVPDVAALAATTLAWQPDASRHAPLLGKLLNSEQTRTWGVAVALGRIRGHEAESMLKQALAGEAAERWAPDIRAQIIDSLGMRGCQDAVGPMIDALADHRPLSVLPLSQLSAQRAIRALQADLAAHGTDAAAAMASVGSAPTVSGVAARWIKLLAGIDAEPLTTQPTGPCEEAVAALKRQWAARQATASRPQ